ncbi:MAG: cob(I)yrinic acid a,c-diamide adenosyltransferase [Cytophagaceae bacterium]|nr:cob(I)yrinic acid a,c-diamide adenosyltransferase [Cytophagaceae bacterium]MDW8455379.1 cob(I)yrinic acid a,c-diamide adenosyltransferase [Cytophagaceae bacterium]
MKIYTKSGDKGFTSLYSGDRISKAHLRIEAYGCVDELNCYVGLLADYTINSNRIHVLREIQDRLFTMGAMLSTGTKKQHLKQPDLSEQDVLTLEREIDAMQEILPPLRFFILPGGHKEVSFCHIARTVCRRAERAIIALHENEPVEEIILKYINRLSDYLFVLARTMAKDLNAEEICWKPKF